MKRVLILGGTGEAAKLAVQAALLQGVEVITSLAGRTRHPVTPAGRVRIGGFGGEAGLVDYLRDQRIDLLIDATHPFAAHISFHAATAAHACGLPYLLLLRPHLGHWHIPLDRSDRTLDRARDRHRRQSRAYVERHAAVEFPCL